MGAHRFPPRGLRAFVLLGLLVVFAPGARGQVEVVLPRPGSTLNRIHAQFRWPAFPALASDYELQIVEDDGPILFPGLNTTSGERTLVLDHQGDDPTRGWQIFYAYPAGRDASCPVEQVVGTRDFIDCDGNTIDVSELSPPESGVNPVVENQRTLIIDLSGVTTG